MRDFSNLRKKVDMDVWSAKKAFGEQLKLQGIDIILDKKPVRALVNNHSNPMNEFKEERQLWLDNNNLKRGSYAFYDNDYYLVVSDIDEFKVKNILINTSAMMRKCNHILKFMNKGKICEYPAIVANASKYTLGVEDMHDLKLANGRFGIQVVDCCDAKDLVRGTRLLFNKSAWEITDRDEVTSKGTLILLCTETQIFTQFDDRENEIADRFRIVTLEKPQEDNTTKEGLIGDTNIKIFNTNTFTMYPMDKYDFDIEYGNVDKNSLIIKVINENTIKIKNNGLTKGEVTLRVKKSERMITTKTLTFGIGGR